MDTRLFWHCGCARVRERVRVPIAVPALSKRCVSPFWGSGAGSRDRRQPPDRVAARSRSSCYHPARWRPDLGDQWVALQSRSRLSCGSSRRAPGDRRETCLRPLLHRCARQGPRCRRSWIARSWATPPTRPPCPRSAFGRPHPTKGLQPPRRPRSTSSTTTPPSTSASSATTTTPRRSSSQAIAAMIRWSRPTASRSSSTPTATRRRASSSAPIPTASNTTGRSLERARAGFRGAGGFNINWDGDWEVEASDLRHRLECRARHPIPHLRYPRADNQIWGFNFQRNIRRRNENAFWAPLPRQFNLYRLSWRAPWRASRCRVSATSK